MKKDKSWAQVEEVVKEVVELVEEIFKEKRLYLPPKKKAELIGLLCEEFLEDE